MASSGDARVAWVESPLQLLNAIEWAAATGEPLDIMARAGLVQLDRTVAALVGHLPAGVTIDLSAGSAVNPRMRGAHSWLLGDVYSGQVKAMLAATGVRDTVIVDDGSAATSMADALAARAALSRPGVAEGLGHRALGLAGSARLAAAARRGRVGFFTAYPDAPGFVALAAAGADVRRNAYAWTRATRPVDAVYAEHVVVGTALIADGHVSRDAYREWLTGHADPSTVYIPHRREDAELALIADLGLTVLPVDVPIEIALAGSPTVRRVSTLPSSVVATLRVILDPEVELDVEVIPSRWWEPGVDPRLRAMLEALAEDR
ncbi:hypothetical protein [Demequina subtropica]|uniref:hypothetical protein n=1 Tax=Demequina subtropica TaxID=1638989 RepID=UPI000785C6AE|nr:hypothetical protein [Demequina subtropica]